MITEEVYIHSLKLPILRAWSCYVDFCEMPFAVDVPILKGLMDEIAHHVLAEMSKHLSQKNLVMLTETLDYLCSEDTLTRVFKEEEPLTSTRNASAALLRKYWDAHIPKMERERVHSIQAENSYQGEKKNDWT